MYRGSVPGWGVGSWQICRARPSALSAAHSPWEQPQIVSLILITIMAKGKATGLWKGKVGNNVFYKITNSNNAQKQGIRERVIEVSNPKTYYQANQRMKLLPAQRIAGALKEIVERGQQGVKYGALSRNEFLSRALSMKSGFPFMQKSDPNVIPGEYQLTKGTLPEIVCAYRSENEDFETSLAMSQDYNTTVGSFSQIILQDNSFLQEGDQLTVVAFSRASTDGAKIIMSGYKSVILDTTSTEELDNLLIGVLFGYGGSNGKLVISNDDHTIIAAAIIISRANGANGFLRSNATLAVNKTDSAIAKYFANKNDALQSYAGDNTIGNNTNWPVDQNDDDPAISGGFVTISVADSVPEGISITGTGRYAVGSQVTLTATGNKASDFECWIINDVEMSRLTDNPWTFNAEHSMRVSVSLGTAVTEP